MLNTFIKLTPVSYCTEQECEEETQCFGASPVYELALPAKPSDLFAWIEEKENANFWDSTHLKVALADSCGNVLVEDIGTVEQSDSQYYISATIPEDTENGGYTFVIYRDLVIQLFSFTPESSPGACDASVTFEIPNEPAESFEWSLDGETFQESSTFNNICQELLTIYVRVVGDTCLSGQKDIDIEPVNCLDYKGFTLQQMKDSGVLLLQIYDCLLSDIQP